MPKTIINSLWLVRERRKKTVRLVTENDNKVQVRVVSASRDPKTQKMVYETFDSFDVVEGKPDEVFAVCKEAIIRKANAK